MSKWTRIVGAAVVAALLAVAPNVRASQPGLLTTGDNLPANLDPHQMFDVPMQFYSLNAYDNLYRYEGNPPQLKPWLADSYTVSPDGLTYDIIEQNANEEPVVSTGDLHLHDMKKGYILVYHPIVDAAPDGSGDDPHLLGQQLAVLFEGATAMATSLNDTAPVVHARAAAATLIDAALSA